MNINPGTLNKRIRIMDKQQTEDADGYAPEDPATVHICWARFTRTSGSEVVKANADFSEAKCRFLIRATNTAINRKMIVRYAGNDYEIVYLNNYEDADEYVEILCRALTLGVSS